MLGLFRMAGPKTRIVIMFVLGVILTGIGVATVNGSTDVMCGSEVMSPGDLCRNVTEGTTKTYAQMKSSDNDGGLILLGIGAVCLIVGVVLIVHYRRRASANTVSAVPPLPGQYPPSPGQYGGAPGGGQYGGAPAGYPTGQYQPPPGQYQPQPGQYPPPPGQYPPPPPPPGQFNPPYQSGPYQSGNAPFQPGGGYNPPPAR
jgi:hypothetical protein